jgi:murein DD-endopeptidase MepM/ murein hydrolase activator NlpD
LRKQWLGIVSLIVSLAFIASPLAISTASAANYPSWQDVLNARNNVAQKEKQINTIKAILHNLQKKLETAQAEAERLGSIYQEAQQAYDEAAYKADQLQGQADDAKKAADASRIRAGQFISELARVGNINISTSLLSDSTGADDLLSKLGFASIIASQADGIYQAAIRDQNSAQSLTDQAKVAADLRDKLRADAEAAFTKAQDAANAVQAVVDEQMSHQATLQAQLQTLIDNKKHTEAEYQKGLAESGSHGSDLPPGQISSKGWARPSAGYISSGFGNRVHPIYHIVMFHSGTDLAGGCGSPIYAARGGKVIYAGWYGGYGNFILIDHGDSVSTAYGHIADKHTFVKYGDQVATGTHIADIGSTGNSTGCHLHFEVRINGKATDPVPFMRDKGVKLG